MRHFKAAHVIKTANRNIKPHKIYSKFSTSNAEFNQPLSLTSFRFVHSRDTVVVTEKLHYFSTLRTVATDISSLLILEDYTKIQRIMHSGMNVH